MGDRPGRYPTDQGFDEWWGFAHSSGETLNNIQPHFAEGGGKIQPLQQGRKGEPTEDVGKYDFAMRPQMDALITQKA